MHEKHNFPRETVRYVLKIHDQVTKCGEGSCNKRGVYQLRFLWEVY